MSLCAGASSTDPRDTYVAGEAYKIFALIKQQAPATSGDAPARLQGNTVAHSTEFTVYPLAVPEAGDIVTAVVTVRSDNAPIGTTYYDLAGHASDRPFHGVNIIVKRHINGETTVSKQVMP